MTFKNTNSKRDISRFQVELKSEYANLWVSQVEKRLFNQISYVS